MGCGGLWSFFFFPLPCMFSSLPARTLPFGTPSVWPYLGPGFFPSHRFSRPCVKALINMSQTHEAFTGPSPQGNKAALLFSLWELVQGLACSPIFFSKGILHDFDLLGLPFSSDQVTVGLCARKTSAFPPEGKLRGFLFFPPIPQPPTSLLPFSK